MLKENLETVKKNIEQACKNAGRNVDEVTLIAVSKTKPVEMLREVYDAGIRQFGENKVQEMCDKMEVLPDDIKWNMIGHLQTNKVKYIVGKTSLIPELVSEIAKLDHLRVRGLMTIAPFVTDPEDNREYFREIKQLSVDIANKNIDNVCMDILSMGMTGDYMVAIEEGATMVRVGTGIFGERNYNK